ncbi:MAG: DUF3857 domain-containing protein [Limisphaerales bacterium]
MALAWEALLAASLCFAQDVHVVVAPPPKWVSPIDFNRRTAVAQASSSTAWEWLLIERQFNAQTDEQFCHQMYMVPASAAGVPAPPLAINYDPGCQLLTLHWVRLWRDAASLSRLDTTKLHFGRPAAPAAGSVFSTNRTALIALDDVRVGDVVDYAYTLTGWNPVLAGRFVEAVPAQLPEPIGRLVTKVLWPASRKLYVQNHGTLVRPTTLQRSNNLIEFTWDLRDVPGLGMESETPPWYDPYPWVQLSEFQTWGDVNAWALRWLRFTNGFSADVTNQIARWNLLSEPQDRVRAALQFVQQEIANTSPEGRAYGYEPASPSGVVARGAGDELEKTLLLVALLRTLRIEADPVLVSTRYQNTLVNYHPSPVLFNHIITGVAVGGQTFWLDATDEYERGPLALRTWPIYGLGLVIHPGTSDLTPIPICPVQPKTTVSAFFSIAGIYGESALKVVTVAEGTDADRLRQRYALRSQQEIDLESINTYVKYYPQIRRVEPSVMRDDTERNRVEVTDLYSIPGLWTTAPNQTEFHCRLYGINVEGAMSRPPQAGREMPWAVPYPVHQVFHAEVPLINLAPTNTGTQIIEHPDFFFRYYSAVVNTNVVLEYEYRTLSDVLMPAAVPSYLERLEQAAATDGFNLMSLELP